MSMKLLCYWNNQEVKNQGKAMACELQRKGLSAVSHTNQWYLILVPYRLSRRQHTVLSILYAFHVAISFWLMLVFMTYNGFLMLTVILGAGVGYYLFGNGYLSANRSVQCH